MLHNVNVPVSPCADRELQTEIGIGRQKSMEHFKIGLFGQILLVEF
jgi:hypothetical protein